jgi:hypothetical protein
MEAGQDELAIADGRPPVCAGDPVAMASTRTAATNHGDEFGLTAVCDGRLGVVGSGLSRDSEAEMEARPSRLKRWMRLRTISPFN